LLAAVGIQFASTLSGIALGHFSGKGEFMTRFFVNDREIPSPPPGFSSLDGILKYIEENHLPPDNVVRQIQIDGLPLLPAERNAVPFDIREGIEKRQKVEITTGSLREIACESVRESIAYLDRIEPVIPSLASSFQAFPGPEAFENLKELYSGFYWLNLLLDRLEKNFRLSFWETSLQGSSFREYQQKFMSVMQQLVGSQEKGDFVLVADLLEYEVLPLLPVWKELFSGIARRLETASPT
jgi:hypothetical protein